VLEFRLYNFNELHYNLILILFLFFHLLSQFQQTVSTTLYFTLSSFSGRFVTSYEFCNFTFFDNNVPTFCLRAIKNWLWPSTYNYNGYYAIFSLSQSPQSRSSVSVSQLTTATTISASNYITNRMDFHLRCDNLICKR